MSLKIAPKLNVENDRKVKLNKNDHYENRHVIKNAPTINLKTVETSRSKLKNRFFLITIFRKVAPFIFQNFLREGCAQR